MDTCEFTASTKKDTQDIQALTKILIELTANLRAFIKDQKKSEALIRSRVQHNTDIQSSNLEHHDLITALDKIDERINALEIHRLTTTAESKVRSSIMEKIAKCGPSVITVLMAFVTIGSIFVAKEFNIKDVLTHNSNVECVGKILANYPEQIV